ncbi:MAG: Hpt domain-containing protein, partial [Rhodocyclaceae bacterium]|nr:Hpt domain-containing protein [Rhodocyclaceae bacterium]
MSIDMSQFHQVFFEETAEHLATMENLLLTLDVAAPDAEQLNAIFRAAHSIKGSSGTFGFTDLAEVTHLLESLLDRVRKGEVRLSEEMIDACLDAGDVLKTLLAAHQGGGQTDAAAVAAISERLEQLIERAGAAQNAPKVGAGGTAPAVAAAPAPQASAGGLELSFTLEGDAAFVAMTFDNLVTELAAHGEVEVLARPAGPGERAHLRLKGVSETQTVRELVEFVAKNDSIRIEPLAALPTGEEEAYGFFSPLPPPASAEERAYGFFTPLPPPELKGEEGYGFFTPLPTPEPKGEEGYGFFVEPTPSAPAPQPPAIAPAPPTVAPQPAGAQADAPRRANDAVRGANGTRRSDGRPNRQDRVRSGPVSYTHLRAH